MARRRLLLLHGPNLNMLGTREPELYGRTTLPELEGLCRRRAKMLGFALDCRQSNHEGDLVTWIQRARGRYAGLLINAGAFTHTSVAIHDALKILAMPIVEVHITDPKTREPFRHVSYIEPLAAKTIAGHGVDGYGEALTFIAALAGGAA